MCLITKVIIIPRAKFHYNRLTTVPDIQDYASLIFGTRRRLVIHYHTFMCFLSNIMQCSQSSGELTALSTPIAGGRGAPREPPIPLSALCASGSSG